MVFASLAACMTREPPQEDASRTVGSVPLDWPHWNPSQADEFAARIPKRIPTFGALEEPVQREAGQPEGRVLTIREAVSAGGAVLIDWLGDSGSDSPRAPVQIKGGEIDSIEYAAKQHPQAPGENSPARFWKSVIPTPDWKQLFEPPREFQIEGERYATPNLLAERIQSAKEYATIPSLRSAATPGIVVWFGGIGPSWKLELESQIAFVRRGFAFVGALESVLSSFARFRIRLQDLPSDPRDRFDFIFSSSFEGAKQRITKLAFYQNASQAGESLGKEISSDVIGSASGAEPILTWLEQQQPDLLAHPLIVVGCSGGVPAAMAFASQHVDRLAGLVIVGGFEDFEQLLARTDLNDGEPTISWRSDTPLLEQQAQFTEAFRTSCAVDPGRLAHAIPTDRVLMIQGRFDTLVPADLSDRLWTSLGRPERWKFFGGHRLLFWRLSAYGDELAEWAVAKARHWSLKSSGN